MSSLLSQEISSKRLFDSAKKFAKISQPRLHDTLPRQRLFALIDKLRERYTVLWIASPPGAGKTSLAASYLLESAAPAVWCQIDQGDSDAATLFFFLAEAIKETGPALPWNISEQQRGDVGFERLFFRDFYARLPLGAIVVFDNIHEFDWANSGNLLEIALSEVPHGITVLALGRDAPPSRLSRLELSGKLIEIGWSDMRFDAEETRALLQRGGAMDANLLAWSDMVDGWVTGLVMLQNLGGHSKQDGVPSLEGREAVFRYFAGEIFERLPEKSRHLLMLLSCLPGVTAEDAEKLTCDKSAPALLNSLYRNRLFVERRGAESQTFSFHALFREFLQHEAEQRLERDTRHALLERAASILELQGRVEDAAQLYVDAGAHVALARLLTQHAKEMLASGRGQTWRDWMSALPPSSVGDDPTLWYWNGISLLDVAPMRARQILEKADQAFLGRGDGCARLLALAAIIDSFDFDYDDFNALPHWAEQMVKEIDALDLATVDPEFDLKIHSRLTIALYFATPDSPALAVASARALRALFQIENPAEQLAAGAMLLRYFDVTEKQESAVWLVSELSKLADDPQISPYHRVKWYARVAWWHNKDGNFSEAEQSTDSVKRIVANFGLDPLSFQLLEIHHLLGTGDLASARSLLDQVRLTMPEGRTPYRIEWYALEANWRALSNDIDGAVEAELAALDMIGGAGLSYRDRSRFEIFLAVCHALKREFDQSRSRQEQAVGHAFGFDATLAREAREFLSTYELFCTGEPERAIELLATALAAHRNRKATTLFVMNPQFAGWLAALALEYEVEAAHIKQIIVRQRLCPPSRYAQNWPWPVAICSFGRFEVRLNGEPVNASGKSQQRPLSLLKALIAAGAGGKPLTRIAAQLWPAAEDAKSALNVTVHRLRKLLGNDELIAVTGGNAQLIDAKLWLDTAALAHICDRVDRLRVDESIFSVQRIAVELLNVYRGPFCDGGDESWLIPMREQCRNRFLSAVVKLGARFENEKNWPFATKLYQRALEAEPLAETTYRNLMRCAMAQHDPAAAFSIFRRCRETLSIVLGRQPSPETVDLVKKLGIVE